MLRLAVGVVGGLLAVAAFGARDVGPNRLLDDIVELPPFVITESRIAKPWRYAETEGFEIISEAGDAATQQVFAALWRGPHLTLPREFHPSNALPLAVILFDRQPDDVGAGQVLATSRGHFTNVIKRTLHDREVFSVNLHGRDFRYATTFRFHLRTLLALHTPTVPRWLREALNGPFGVYDDTFYYREGTDTLVVGRVGWPAPSAGRPLPATTQVMALDRLWTNVVRVPASNARALPRATAADGIVEMPPFLVTETVDRAAWSATAALFAHWALVAENGKRRAAFWRFASEACARPVTEAFFRECFGLTYEQAHDALVRYLPTALRGSVNVTIAPLSPPTLRFREATGAEVARLRGEFERSEALILATRVPEIAAKYREQAARTFRRGLETAPGDARITANLGLLEFESGRVDSARALLETAAAAGTMRPRAALVLAQLRFVAASKAASDASEPFNAAQTAAVLQPLQQALDQQPKMAASFGLLAALWRRAPELPADDMTRRLHEGQQAFPGDATLALACARACFERGRRRDARELLERSLASCTDAGMRERLARTLARIPADE